MKIAKQQRKQMRKGFGSIRRSVSSRVPQGVRRIVGPLVDYLDMLFVDHGIFRVIYPNLHRLGDRAWRSSQPAPHQIRAMARKGIKTIVNLRGDRDCGGYRLEVKTCSEVGINLINFQVKSRAAPLAETVREAERLFREIEYPALFHCKSGADRVGLMSALYVLFERGQPLEKAMDQLHWRYGHFRQADTGVLDHFFEVYRDENAAEPISFHDWLATRYEPADVHASFKTTRWANTIVNTILRRE